MNRKPKAEHPGAGENSAASVGTQAGAVAFLRKPVSEQALISSIQAVLRQGRRDENEHRDPK
jgi:FixJ family two-component response regulator